ncbi:MAG: MmcQ/YjbR family DNA-binding protein [Prevotellaceae bacterium]|jgi:predicted DNA-binding protein (MmcQ/YjbR family)|nr:MmcQ/YjbR family DNA-binding protein [Prevotellaceae bacterium]
MNIEEIREYCLSKPRVTEELPFDDETIAFKVCDKIFALVSLQKAVLNIKSEPDKAVALREQYASVVEPYHMHKKMWNSILVNNEELPGELLRSWIDESYRLVVDKLPKIKQRQTRTFI